ncbi:MAG TPA: flagellar basal body-associated FliL family protein [Steroidobacteraceae bacterium]|nr:flagellar basal body-associated FliL family protein [Steroidobacteraceae bacterium]
MADIPTLEPAADVPLADGGDAAAPRGRRPWLLIAVAAAALVVAAGGGWLWFAHSAAKQKGAGAAEPAPTGPALYVALDPPFVTNFEADQVVRFLQLSVQVMTHDAATVDLIKANDPVIRNDLLLLFSNQKYADIATREGKERLRAAALAAVRKAVAANGGKPERIEALYFTSFVMQ